MRCLLVHFPSGTALLGFLILGVADDGGVETASQEIRWVRSSGSGRERIRLNRKTPAHLAGSVIQSRPRVWKRLRHVGHFDVSCAACKRRRYDQHDGDYVPVYNRTGVG